MTRASSSRTDSLSPDALLGQSYAAVGRPELWNGLLSQWAQALGADSGLLFSPGDQFMAQPMHGHSYDFETARDYGSYYHQHDIWTQSAIQKGIFEPGRSACGELLAPQNTLRKSLFYNEFLRRMDQEWLLCTVLFKAGNALALPETVLSFYRRPGRRAFGRGAVAALNRALPHLQRCVTLHHELLRARVDQSLFASGLDQLAMGVLLFTASGQLQFANRRAEALLRTAAGQPPALLAALQQLDRRARQGCYGGQRLHTAQGPVYAVAAPNHRLAPDAQLQRGRGSVIWLIDPRQKPSGPLGAAADLFGLTPAEQKVLGLLMQDMAPRLIARELGTALSTVRSQLSALLQKTGTSRQQDLLSLMAAFPVE